MVSNQFFLKQGPFPLKEIANKIKCMDNSTKFNDLEIHGMESLMSAGKNDITFLNSPKYKNISLKTNAAACITTTNFSSLLPAK